MKRRTIFWIAGGVIAAHIAVFFFIGGWIPVPTVKYVAPPNFSLGWAKFTDPATKQKMVYEEFTVSTHVNQPDPGTPPAQQTPTLPKP